MLKMLFWAIVGYVVYRYFKIKAELKEGNRNDHLNDRRRQEEPSPKKGKDGDFIDYEEIK